METPSEMYIDGEYVLNIKEGLENLNNQLPPDNKYEPSQNTGFMMIEINNNMVEEMEHFTEKPDSSLQTINKDYVFVKKNKDELEKTHKIEEQKTIDTFKKLDIPKVSSDQPVVQEAPIINPPAKVESVVQEAPTKIDNPPAEVESVVQEAPIINPPAEVESVVQDAPTKIDNPPAEVVPDVSKEKKETKKETPKNIEKKQGTKRKKSKKGGRKTKKRKRTKRKKKKKRRKKKTKKKK